VPETRGRARIRTEHVRPIPLPEPGKHLRNAVETVLAELPAGASPTQQALHHLDDTLRTALAWTAASGDTCRVAAAVHAVRDARVSLDAEDLKQARVALLTARDGLRLPTPRRVRQTHS
jgi:hypothetical protein